MMWRAELVTETRRLDEIGPAWDRLWRRSGQSLFQAHGWVRAWWAAHEPTRRSRLHIGLCWDGDTLCAVIPCITRRHRGIRVLEWAAKDCTDYCDAILAPGAQPALEAAWQAMAAGGFHVAHLSHVRRDATALHLTGTRPPLALRPAVRTTQTLQVRRHGLTGAEWFRTLTKKARNNHTRGKRIVGESGSVSIGIATGAEAARQLEPMIAFKRQWLAATKQRSALLEDDARMLRSLAAFLQQCGALQLFSLICDGRLVAGLVSIVHGTQAAAFFSAFDPGFERASPGTLVIVEQLIWAFDQGLPEVDFLCGDEAYKAKFADSSTGLAAYVGARTLLGHAALAAGEWLDRRRLGQDKPPAITTPMHAGDLVPDMRPALPSSPAEF